MCSPYIFCWNMKGNIKKGDEIEILEAGNFSKDKIIDVINQEIMENGFSFFKAEKNGTLTIFEEGERLKTINLNKVQEFLKNNLPEVLSALISNKDKKYLILKISEKNNQIKELEMLKIAVYRLYHNEEIYHNTKSWS